MSDEKTEEPSEKKLTDARRDGETSKSQDLPFAAILFSAAIGFSLGGPVMTEQLRLLLRMGLDVANAQSENFSYTDALVTAGMRGLALCLPIALLAALISAAVIAAQVGLQLAFKPLELKFNSINPASGLKRIFSMRSMIELAKTVVKACILGTVLWKTVLILMPLLIGVVYQPILGLDSIAWGALCKMLAISAVVFLVIGTADFAIQRWLFIRDHRMSKDEVKRENKESNGNPEIKQELRKLSKELANAPQKSHVGQANVVVVNPTHYAVALRYAPEECGLPRVIAKGTDEEARVIRELATLHGVPIVGNPPLARALYLVALEETIPEPLFDAVAAVLAWVDDMGKGHTTAVNPA
ncbi:type III secretion system export apparatus subunit SctU [Collimonas sp. H4R21]|jgi:type III secretion protein U|uniref:Type III secretion system export apparatus subunit SctU n=1 Tax=Collimonas rhizosphaerae TaxID=3126357 RepID=A0ABU9PP49_9BURK